ncbi:hypothetical protein J0H58_18930 [bacterium]|nr:hypothetical protein [bacterium]
MSIWHVTSQGERGETRTAVVPLGVDATGQRVPSWERQADTLFQQPPSRGAVVGTKVLAELVEPMLQRELHHRGGTGAKGGFDARLVGWVEVG